MVLCEYTTIAQPPLFPKMCYHSRNCRLISFGLPPSIEAENVINIIFDVWYKKILSNWSLFSKQHLHLTYAGAAGIDASSLAIFFCNASKIVLYKLQLDSESWFTQFVWQKSDSDITEVYSWDFKNWHSLTYKWTMSAWPIHRF